MNRAWTSVALADAAELNPSLPRRPSSDEKVSFVPMAAVSARTAAVENEETRYHADVAKGFTPFLKGDVLVAKITPCFENGKIAQANVTRSIGFGSTEFHVVRPKGGKLDARYLLHYLRQERVRRVGKQRMTGSGGQRRVPENFLSSLEIPLPPLSEQRRIAEVLDRAEALRAKRRAALAQLDSLTQSLFLDLFGDPVSNPKQWPVVRFEEVCARITVGIVVKPASYYVSEGVPALRSLNIRPGKIVLEDLVYFSKVDNETKLTKTKLKAGDLVLVRSGQPGTAAVVPPELDGVNAIDVLIATPLAEFVDSKFVCEFFNSKGGHDIVLSNQRGQVQKHLNVGSLNVAKIPLPPLPLQLEFARRVTAVEKLKVAHRASLAETDALFASLQHRAFRGEL